MATRVRLLGEARVFHGEDWLTAPLDKRFCLLAYLACADGAVTRERLAYLFWPELENVKARRNLRRLISRVKELGFVAYLDIMPEHLRWSVDSDVQAFRQALNQEEWASAVALYSGELLQGVNLNDSPEYSAWLELERQTLYAAWRKAVIMRALELERSAQPLKAADLLRRLLDAEELAEDALQGYLRCAALAGQRDVALKTYESFAAKLKNELGLEPLAATAQLVQELRKGISAPSEASAFMLSQARLRNFPAQSTPFIGRDLELTDILNTLSRPECRLLTLLGSGGIGKSRLALQAATAAAAGYADGVTFVALASVSDAHLLASSIASALSFSFYGQAEPEHQLVSYLRDKEMLLVLDNLEHLLKGVDFVASLMEICPRLKLLATSRERLRLTGEWLYEVSGMTLPEGEGTTQLERYDAIHLFLHSARRIQANFALHDNNRATVLHICRLVGGAPLGIELASGWLRLLSCDEIASELSKSLELLSSPLHDMPERHHSLRSVFEHSWRLLSEEERIAFKRLSIFQGGFTREAAEMVANVSRRSLLALLDKSLLRRSPTGRFGLHELVKQYAAEKLAETPEEEEATRDRHSAYYAAFLHAREGWMKGGERQLVSLQEIEEEIGNVRSAWRWAAQKRDLVALEQSLDSLFHFYQNHGLFQEGEEAFRLAAEGMKESVTLAKLLARQGAYTWQLHHLDASEELSRRSLAMLARLGEPPDVFALINLSLAPMRRGDDDLAEQRSVELLEFSRASGNAWGMAAALNNLGNIAGSNLGNIAGKQRAFDKAESYHKESVSLFRELNDHWGLALALGDLGFMYLECGKLEAAEAPLQDCLTFARNVGFTPFVVRALAGLGDVSCKQGRHEQAEAYYREALGAAEERGLEGPLVPTTLNWDITRVRIGLGETTCALKRYRESLNSFHKALTMALGCTLPQQALKSLVGTADLLIRLGEEERALELLAFSLSQSSIHQETRDRAERLRANLTARLPTKVATKAQERGQALRYGEIDMMFVYWQQHIKA